jgi:copine 5/8/9
VFLRKGSFSLTFISPPPLFICPTKQVIVQEKVGGNWQTVGETETIDDDLNPRFATSVSINYFFEKVQHVRFVVIDVDGNDVSLSLPSCLFLPKNPRLTPLQPDWRKHDLIGTLDTTLGKVIGSRGGSLSGDLVNPERRGKKLGSITCTAEEVSDSKVICRLRFSARHVDKKDFFGKSDPFLVILKRGKGAEEWVKVHQTEVIKNNLNPVWRPFEISAAKLNGGEMERRLRFEVYDWDKRSSPDFIGAAEASILEFEQRSEIPLINPKKAKKKKRSYSDSGLLRCDGVELKPQPSFVDFIRGGCQLNMMVSVDFTVTFCRFVFVCLFVCCSFPLVFAKRFFLLTMQIIIQQASNGRVNQPTSLHYRTPYQPNMYESAISSVGNILAPYDWDGKFPVYGFGAKLPPSFAVSHFFPLSGDPDRPEVVGVDGILGAYQNAVNNVQLYGPTNFAPTIRAACHFAKEIPLGEGYFILLILTDGVITDMDATVDALVDASALPLSVIIIGIGNADFENMDILVCFVTLNCAGRATNPFLQTGRGRWQAAALFWKTCHSGLGAVCAFQRFCIRYGSPPSRLAPLLF